MKTEQTWRKMKTTKCNVQQQNYAVTSKYYMYVVHIRILLCLLSFILCLFDIFSWLLIVLAEPRIKPMPPIKSLTSRWCSTSSHLSKLNILGWSFVLSSISGQIKHFAAANWDKFIAHVNFYWEIQQTKTKQTKRMNIYIQQNEI